MKLVINSKGIGTIMSDERLIEDEKMGNFLG